MFFTLFAFATVIVITRIVLRRFYTVTQLYPDDILIIIAWVFGPLLLEADAVQLSWHDHNPLDWGWVRLDSAGIGHVFIR